MKKYVFALLATIASVGSAHAQTAKPSALPAPKPSGARVFVKYYWTTYPSLKVNIGHLLLFPDGTAFDAIPYEPLSSWNATTLRGALEKREVGKWKMAGKKLVLSFPNAADNRTLTKNARGWADPSGVRMKGANYNVYFPALNAPRARVLGAWKNQSLNVMGEMGGGAAQVVSGATGDWIFRADGTFSNRKESFMSGTTANMPSAYKGQGDVYTNRSRKDQAAGKWRLDGPLLTLERGGKRTVHLAFLLPQWGKNPNGTDLMIDDERWERPEKR